jgi:hypothetical protein
VSSCQRHASPGGNMSCFSARVGIFTAGQDVGTLAMYSNTERVIISSVHLLYHGLVYTTLCWCARMVPAAQPGACVGEAREG